jgi:hypothetical protein
VKRAFALYAIELLVGGMLVHRTLGAGIVTVNPGVKMIGCEKYFLTMPDIQFGHFQNINKLSAHHLSSLVSYALNLEKTTSTK